MIDNQIRAKRNQFRNERSDEKALEVLREINSLQRLRKLETGKFLPHKLRDGTEAVYYYDLDLERWMELKEFINETM